MSKARILQRMLGIATLAMMFGTGSVYAQSASSASDTSGASGKSSTESSSGSSGSSSSGSSADKPSVGNTTGGDTSGASGSSGSSASSSDSSSGASESSSKSASSQSVSKQDRKMMQDLAHANASEIAAGKLALEKSQNDQVKQYAQKMIDDHTQAQQELQKLADAKGVKLENEPDTKHKAMVKSMSALEGEKFDKMYISQGGTRDHKNTHQLLQKIQKQSKDKDLQALAQKIEPTVKEHLTMAQDIRGGKSSSSGTSGSSGSSSGGSSSGSSSSGGSSSGGSSDSSGTSGSSGASDSSGASGASGSSSGGSSGSSSSK